MPMERWFSAKGSSPHTRGAPCRPRRIPALRGIIPAYAGSTLPGSPRSQPRRDHPRIRGEHYGSARGDLLAQGSSPHTRGAPAITPSSLPTAGIIPAYAGSTRRQCRASQTRWDHPRIRGEHSKRIEANQSGLGSSPHTRGALSRRILDVQELGIIPAYAGSTRPTPTASSPRRDHPRIRGEHSTPFAASCAVVGSSPHTRGARAAADGAPRGEGIIPAYAGSTLKYLVII